MNATIKTLANDRILLTVRIEDDYMGTCPRLGDEGVLVVCSGRHGESAHLHNGPVPGNMNREITRYHGWRGTTNDVACYAKGQRRVEKIRETRNLRYLTLSADLLPEED